MGLWPGDRDLVDELIAVMQEEVAGLYDPWDRALYIVSDTKAPFLARLMSAFFRRDLQREIVLSHELVHLLQHASYPSLMDSDPFFYDHDDVGSAIQAAIEGDATRYGFEALELLPQLPDPSTFREEIDSELASIHDGAFAAAPALIRLTLAFPYTHGYRLSYGEGKALLDSPPASTEQVLHAGKRGEPFLAIDLRPLHDALPDGCRFIHENTLGELEISVLFRDLATDPPEDTWAGWDGDRYLVAECDERPAILWLTVWDSRTDALEFETAYRGIFAALVARAGLAAAPNVTRSEREVLVHSDELAPLAKLLSARAHRERVSTLPELRDHFDAGAGAGQGDRDSSSRQRLRPSRASGGRTPASSQIVAGMSGRSMPSISWRPGRDRGCETINMPRMTCSPERGSGNSPDSVPRVSECMASIRAAFFHQMRRSGVELKRKGSSTSSALKIRSTTFSPVSGHLSSRSSRTSASRYSSYSRPARKRPSGSRPTRFTRTAE
jgi:hypothetical protein